MPTQSARSSTLRSHAFSRDEAELPSELRDYFAGFDLILSYLYDPDGIFEENLRRCGAENILRGPSKIVSGMSAAEQLAQPVQELGINCHRSGAENFSIRRGSGICL